MNDTNYRCSDFASYFSNGKEMCESFFPEQLMGNNLIRAVRPGEPCITPGEPDESAAIVKLDEKSFSEVEYRNHFKTYLNLLNESPFSNDQTGIFFSLVKPVNGGSGGIYF